MEKNKKRALRRHHDERMYKKALKIGLSYYIDDDPEKWAINFARRAADNLKMCSCVHCGNPRRNFGGYYGYDGRFTMQERRARDSEFNQIKEWEES